MDPYADVPFLIQLIEKGDGPIPEPLRAGDYAMIGLAVTDYLGFDVTTREQQDRIANWAARKTTE